MVSTKGLEIASSNLKAAGLWALRGVAEPDPFMGEGNGWLGTPVLLGAPSSPPSPTSLPHVDKARLASDPAPLGTLAALWVFHSFCFRSLLSC